jgi:hypothetical protein
MPPITLPILLFIFSLPHAPCGSGFPQAPATGVSVQDMTSRATVVGVATVMGEEVREDPGNRVIYTDYRVKFTDVWKGDPSDPFVVTKAGGELGGQAVAILGQEYRLSVGDTVVLFVHPDATGNRHIVIGMRQGLYKVSGSGEKVVSRMSDPRPPRRGAASPTLAHQKEEIYLALGKPPPPPSGTTGEPSKEKPTGVAPASVLPNRTPSSSPEDNTRTPSEGPRGLRPGLILAGLLLIGVVVWILMKRNSLFRITS